MIENNERINEINDNLKLIEKKNGLTFGTDAYLLSAFLPKKQNMRLPLLIFRALSSIMTVYILLMKEFSYESSCDRNG
jgi:hypothetical protein